MKEESNEFTIVEIQNLRVDAIYGKKKHYNAADRKEKYHKKLGLIQITLNVILGSYLFGAAATTVPNALNWIGAILALVSATAAGLQTYYNYERQVELHRSIAGRYLAVIKECSRLIAYHKDKAIEASLLRQQFETLSSVCDQINSDSIKCPTNEEDYKKAQEGFKAGEEEYTENERSSKK